MAISKDGNGALVEGPFTKKDQFERCGIVRDDVFAVVDDRDVLKQIKFDSGNLPTGTGVIIQGNDSTSGTVTIKLPATSGTLVTSGGVLPALGNGHVFVGDASSEAQDVAISGDATLINTGALTVISVGGELASDIATATVDANAATNANTVSTIVKRDSSGNFAAGEITADLVGDVTGNVSGSSASFTGNLDGDVSGPQSSTVVDTVGGSTAANIAAAEALANAATNANTVSTIVKRDSSGNFSAGTITANLTGNASGTAANITGTAAVVNGGTGQTSYTDGQLLIGNSSGNTLTKATLTAGTNITITNGNGTIEIAASGGGSAPNSFIALDSGNGFGSTNTKIRRWTNVNANIGSDMTLTQSSTDGDSITINTTGIYSFTYTDRNSGGTSYFGISLNGSDLTTNLTDQTYAQGKRALTCSTSDSSSTSVTLRLVATDVIRFHGDGSLNSTDTRSVASAIRIA